MCLITSCITCVFNLKKSFNYIKITLFFGGKDMKTLKGSQTEKNLLAAFAGESQAHTKYAYYASVARKEGHTDFAELFEETTNMQISGLNSFTMINFLQLKRISSMLQQVNNMNTRKCILNLQRLQEKKDS